MKNLPTLVDIGKKMLIVVTFSEYVEHIQLLLKLTELILL